MSIALAASGCSRGNEGAVASGPVDVEVVRVEQKDVPIYRDWIGTLDGMVNADIKPQVSGYLLRQRYVEGSYVKTGQLMFEIDPRPFQAALRQTRGRLSQTEGQSSQAKSQLLQAEAQLAQAKANQGKTELDVNRYTPLARERAIPQQDLDNAIQFNLAAKAQVEAAASGVESAKALIAAAKAAVEAARAEVETARLNLGFTQIRSPIDGISGIAQAQVGDLVSPSGEALTTVSTVNPIKAYFTVSEQEYLNYVRTNPTQVQQEEAARQLELELILADGTTYPQSGKFYVSGRSVDVRTGAIQLAALFPNPGNVLRPGQYGKVRAQVQIKAGALLVPQRAVSELQGIYQVAVVGADNRVSLRTVRVSERVGTMWVVDEGLDAGESIVVEGTQKVRQGMPVNPRPFAGASDA